MALCLSLLFHVEAWAERRVVLRSPYEAAVRAAVRDVDAAPSPAAQAEPSRVVGAIVPHHDIALDMIVRAYREMASRAGAVRRVWLIAPDHFQKARRAAAVCPADWATGDGLLRADTAALAALAPSRFAETRADLFAREHGITLHIPLIARFFPNATVVPIVLRPDVPDMALISLRNRIAGVMDGADLVILSMDFSHYKPPEGLAAEDDRTIPILLAMRHTATGALDIDTRRGASLALMLFKARGARRGELLERADSSSVLGTRVESGTSYATILYGVRSAHDNSSDIAAND